MHIQILFAAITEWEWYVEVSVNDAEPKLHRPLTVC